MVRVEYCTCGHSRSQHGPEWAFFTDTDSRREVCMECPGYEEPGYPNGRAWHRFKEQEASRAS